MPAAAVGSPRSERGLSFLRGCNIAAAILLEALPHGLNPRR
jgi:hypothetical protein